MKNLAKDALIKSDSAVQTRILQALHAPDDFVPHKRERTWHEILMCLPPALQAALSMEREAGNRVTSFLMSDGPHKGSVVVAMAEPFQPARKRVDDGARWRLVNDPHYWREEASFTLAGAEHLIIA